MKSRKTHSQNSEDPAVMIEEPSEELELYPDFILDDSGSDMTVVIKHNYYSSDNEHGRELLASFLDVIIDDYKKISRVIFIDSGVLLFCNDDDLFRYSNIMQEKGLQLLLCRESLAYHKVDIERSTGLDILSSHEIALEIMNSPFITVLA